MNRRANHGFALSYGNHILQRGTDRLHPFKLNGDEGINRLENGASPQPQSSQDTFGAGALLFSVDSFDSLCMSAAPHRGVGALAPLRVGRLFFSGIFFEYMIELINPLVKDLRGEAMLKNNIEMDIKIKCIEESKTQASIAEGVGTSPAYINKIVRNREQIVNKTFLAIMEELGYDVRLTYEKRERRSD